MVNVFSAVTRCVYAAALSRSRDTLGVRPTAGETVVNCAKLIDDVMCTYFRLSFLHFTQSCLSIYMYCCVDVCFWYDAICCDSKTHCSENSQVNVPDYCCRIVDPLGAHLQGQIVPSNIGKLLSCVASW